MASKTIKRLYRSRTERVIAGVCGGLAEYFAIDPTLVRIIFFVLAFGGGFGIWAYLALWIFLPLEGDRAGVDLGARFDEAGQVVRSGAERVEEELQKIKKNIRGPKKDK